MRGALASLLLVIATQNVSHSLPRDDARHDIARAAQHSSVVVTQEMGQRHAALLAPAGWGVAHAAGPRRGDCATYWKRTRWHLIRSWVRQLTYAPIPAGHRWAQVAILRHGSTQLAVVCIHMLTRGHRPAYRRGMHRLHQLLASLPQRHVVVGGDWNLPPYRAHPIWPHSQPARTGPHGGRDDWLSWHGARFRHRVILYGTRSDHDGVRLRLALH
jgi:hypothetical protein